jgi:hypothetical protein
MYTFINSIIVPLLCFLDLHLSLEHCRVGNRHLAVSHTTSIFSRENRRCT